MKSTQQVVRVGPLSVGNRLPFALIAGPCVMESRAHLWGMAGALKKICSELKIPLIFKCSYDKANRTSHQSFRGHGIREGLEMLAEVKKNFGLTLLTDVHEPQEAERAAAVADVLQIPAFLSRQTNLIEACSRTGRVVNIKKGQFLAPWEVANIVEKARHSGAKSVFVTERGTSFGYNNLVVDMRGLEIMKRIGVPVVFDATHSVQLPGAKGRSSGGQREFVFPLARAAVAVGVAGVFMEVHPNPDRALSDGGNTVKLSTLKSMLRALQRFDALSKKIIQ